MGEKYGIVNLKGEIIVPIEIEGIAEENGLFKVVTPRPKLKFLLLTKVEKLSFRQNIIELLTAIPKSAILQFSRTKTALSIFYI